MFSLLWEAEAVGCVLCLHTVTVLSRTFPVQTPGNASCLCSIFIQKSQETWTVFLILPCSQQANKGWKSPWIKVQSPTFRPGVQDSLCSQQLRQGEESPPPTLIPPSSHSPLQLPCIGGGSSHENLGDPGGCPLYLPAVPTGRSSKGNSVSQGWCLFLGFALSHLYLTSQEQLALYCLHIRRSFKRSTALQAI